MKKEKLSTTVIMSMIAAILLVGCSAWTTSTVTEGTATSVTAAVGKEDLSSTLKVQNTIKPDETTAKAETSEPAATTATANEINLSGNANDTFVAMNDCYVVGDDVILFIQKGVTVRGDTLNVTENIVNEIEKATGYTFDPKYDMPSINYVFESYFTENAFYGINEEREKVEILIVDMDDMYLPYATDGCIVVDYIDYAPDGYYQTIVHELSHAVHSRNGNMLGSVLNEGFAAYMEDKVGRNMGLPTWDTIQYFNEDMNPATYIEGGEETFTFMYDAKGPNYQYGIRFVSFLLEEYGEQTFKNIVTEATARGFDESFSLENQEADKAENTRQLVEIIKSQTSEDVFERFRAWYPDGWERKEEAYYNYMQPYMT